MALSTGLIGAMIHGISPGSVVAVVLGLGVLYFILDHPQISLSHHSSLLLINGSRPIEFSNDKTEERYMANAEAMLDEGFEKVSNAYVREIHDNP